MRTDQIFPTVADLRADDVQAYLRGRGWFVVPDPREIVVTYRNDAGFEVVVPIVRDIGDYARRLGELVDTVSASENRLPQEVLDDLSLPPGDILTFRVRSELVASGTIPLLDSIQLREAQKNLILAAAHSVSEPRRYFPRMGIAEPVALLSTCREGQTARGSYTTTLLVPVDPSVGAQVPFDESYGRRVTRLLMETLHVVHQRLSRADGEGLLAEPPLGLSYNFLAALADMKPAGERATLDIGVRWARSRPVPVIPPRVSFNEPQFVTMRAVAGALREQAPTHCVIDGYVTRLSRHPEDIQADGEVVLITTLGERPTEARVHVCLDPDVYRGQAIPAHRDGRRVRVAGVLRREGRSWTLTGQTGFEVLPGDDE